jgi:hypothetical protein
MQEQANYALQLANYKRHVKLIPRLGFPVNNIVININLKVNEMKPNY